MRPMVPDQESPSAMATSSSAIMRVSNRFLGTHGRVSAVAKPPLWQCPNAVPDWSAGICGTRAVGLRWRHCFPVPLLGSSELPASMWHLLESLGDVQVLPQKTRLVAVARVRFAGLYPRKDHFLASFALHRWLTDARIVKTIDYGPRWRGHYVRITSAADLDAVRRAWLQESHDIVACRRSSLPHRDSTHTTSAVTLK